MVTLFLLALSAATLADVQGETLRDTARRVGVPFAREVGCECVKVPVERLVSQADLIVVGTITTSSAHLTGDERDIYSEHLVRPEQIIAQRGAPAAGKPGEISPIVVEQHGGTVQIEGISVSVNVAPLPIMKPGTRALLILRQSKDGRYTVVADYGAFQIEGTHLRPLTSKAHLYQEYVGADAAAVIRQVREISERRWTEKRPERN